MGQILKEAFEKRMGRQDHESFMLVVEAFFEELEKDALIDVPISITAEGVQPIFAQLKDGKQAIVIVTDRTYMNYYRESSQFGMTPKALVKMMKDNDCIGGILINPHFRDCHCFLPREDTLSVLDANGIDIEA